MGRCQGLAPLARETSPSLCDSGSATLRRLLSPGQAADPWILRDESTMNSSGALPKIGLSIMERIGNTPLLRLERVCHEVPHAEVYGKAEWTNPGGSVKDRAAAS